MMKCSCCGNDINTGHILSGGTLIMVMSATIYRLCSECLDFLWANRNPDRIASDKEVGEDNVQAPHL